MKILIRLVILIIVLISVTSLTNAMWAKLSDKELIEKSEIIITAELIGHTEVTINQINYNVGILKVGEVLKGDTDQTALLLVMPSSKGPHKSDDILYKRGQKGLWLLRERKNEEEAGLYLADNPQRFTPEEYADDQIKEIRRILKDN